MRIDIITLFCEMFDGFCSASIVGRAVRSGLVDIRLTNLRDYAVDAYGSVDDLTFGGGPGMILMCQPMFDAVEAVQKQAQAPGKVILLSPQGRPMDHKMVEQLAREPRLILLAGHYEGFDERIRTHLADMEVSLGDFVLSGGEVPAMALTEAVVRLQSGALGKAASLEQESFSMELLEYPQYTRPREFRGLKVPQVLLSGHHAKIDEWRRKESQERTKRRRPDIWQRYVEGERRRGERDTSGTPEADVDQGGAGQANRPNVREPGV
ncbi:MAG: tRNA (guanosine(37)-N1)-methyltransferase TrmD [Planctomycetes bacterium]|nr:tRNA (guanosine(37)-N1)-methyltransferase TrmD [Planctomycetota bacterium]